MVSDLYASLAEPPFQLSKAATANMPKVSASIVSDLDAPLAVPTFTKLLQDAFAVQQFVSLAVASLPAAAPAFALSLNFVAALALQGFEARPPHFVVSGSQHVLPSTRRAQVAPAHLVVGLVFNLYPAEQKPVVGHVALAVQQFVSLAVASLPAVTPAFVVSLNFVAALALQGSEARPPHFVVSASQHVPSSPVVPPQPVVVETQAAPGHLLGLVFNLYPAEQKPVVGHVPLAVQQFVSLAVASLPAVAPAFALSLNFVAALALQGSEARPPHTVVSTMQHAPTSAVTV